MCPGRHKKVNIGGCFWAAELSFVNRRNSVCQKNQRQSIAYIAAQRDTMF